MSEPIEQQIQKLHRCQNDMLAELGKVVVGQREVLEQLLTTIFAGGHNLLEGVPGLAKTLMISTLSR
ncbi:MAG: AAA family ATPase, partial [Limisphaerales bacterium]